MYKIKRKYINTMKKELLKLEYVNMDEVAKLKAAQLEIQRLKRVIKDMRDYYEK